MNRKSIRGYGVDASEIQLEGTVVDVGRFPPFKKIRSKYIPRWLALGFLKHQNSQSQGQDKQNTMTLDCWASTGAKDWPATAAQKRPGYYPARKNGYVKQHNNNPTGDDNKNDSWS